MTTSSLQFTSRVLTLERQDRVCWIWLDNADRRNAMGQAFWGDLPRAVAACDEDADIRVIVLAARGGCFSSGLDLGDSGMSGLASNSSGSRATGPDATWRLNLYHHVRRLQAAFTALEQSPKPVIAAIHGVCYGGGVDLAAACDIRLAAEDARFSVRETKLAMVADVGTIQRLPRVIALGAARELIYTGGTFDATRARNIGFVNAIYKDAAALHAAAAALAGEIATNSPLAVQGAKRVMTAGAEMSVAQSLDYVALWNSAFIHSNDIVEAMKASVEKRAPDFTGT